MSDYNADKLYHLLKDNRGDEKVYVDIDGHYLEVTGGRVIQNGGSILLTFDKDAVEHVRKRLGNYDNLSHKPERRK